MEWGFDLTDFKSAESFKNLLRRHKLASGYKRVYQGKDQWKYYGWQRMYHYTWSRKGLKLITGNNPLTKGRQLNKGYASYIGIKGRDKDVKALAMDIKKTARYIKGESPGKRDFI